MTPSGVADESPFVTIWEAPRATIRRLVDAEPRRWVNRLFFAAGAVGGIDVVAGRLDQLGLPLLAVPAACLLLGLLYVPLGHLNALFRRWVGGLLGGRATRSEVAAASAWSGVPIVVGHGALWMVQLALYGGEALAAERPTMDAAPQLLRTSLALGSGLFTLWSIVVSIVAFAEVNRFSIARSLATSVLSFAIVATIAGVVIVAVLLL